MKPKAKRLLILGAAGRDFHNFNTAFRDNPAVEVVGFTAAQIPNISDRRYPAALAGPSYPKGIPIFPEADLEQLIAELKVDTCVFSYSDVSYETVMHLASRVMAAGAGFEMLGPAATQLPSSKPVISICATRTGCGKSQTARHLIELLMAKGLRVVAVRHPMPYGDLAAQKVQRFATLQDLQTHRCTIEEMEEYEPHVERGNVIYAGVDYEAILRAAENDPDGCDIIVWDGGNNDFSFFRPDWSLVVTDPHRADHALRYYPGEVVLRTADAVIINKIDSASPTDINRTREVIAQLAPGKPVVDAASPLRVANPNLIRGKRVLAVEDGPTVTHGGVPFGAAVLAARKWGAAELVDPRPWLVGQLADTFAQYPAIGPLLPAMGYGEGQLRDLQATIDACDCDAVLIGTPIDLSRVIRISKPNTRVFYDLQPIGQPTVADLLDDFLTRKNLMPRLEAAMI